MTEAKKKQIALDYRSKLDLYGEKKRAMLETLNNHGLTPGARSSIYRWCKKFKVKIS